MESENGMNINKVSAEAFLVKDKSLLNFDAPFYEWLLEQGFKHAWHKGHYGCCDWVYINITHKLFAYGMPGVPIVQAIGNHAITIDEFWTIYDIYQKYVGLEPLALSLEEEKERHRERYYVHADGDSRRRLIEMLEKDGFGIEKIDAQTKQEILESKFPINVNVTDKLYGTIFPDEDEAEISDRTTEMTEFLVLYKKSKCSYEEYYSVLKELFMKYGHSEEETDEFFASEKIFIKTSYEEFRAGRKGQSPAAAAGCLDMMF